MRAKEFISEGGWASTATQNTIITPQIVAAVMKTLLTSFVPALNQFLKGKDLAPTKISRPGGSATYYERDLKQNPTKEYGDIDVQFHIPRIPGMGNSANETVYKNAIKEFCDASHGEYATGNGTNIILHIGQDAVQVDLIMSYYENEEWTKALAPEWNVKGVLCNSLYSSLGEVLSLSIGGGHGIQGKFQNGELVPFRMNKDVVLKTITNDPKNWAVDLAKFLGCKQLDPLLTQNPGMKDEVRIADIVASIKGLARSMEANGVGGGDELIQQVKSIYLSKIEKAINSSKFDKAETPAAIQKAAHTKEMLAKKSAEIAALFDR
jgi:hypothetical protein